MQGTATHLQPFLPETLKQVLLLLVGGDVVRRIDRLSGMLSRHAAEEQAGPKKMGPG